MMHQPRGLLRLSALVLALGLASLPTVAAIHHVSPEGDDAAPGSTAQPWRTVAKAAGSAGPGDTVYFHSGSWNERFVPQASGTAGSPISFVAYPGETATIDGSGIALDPDSGLVDLSGRSHIRISGLRVVSSTAVGIYADGGASLVIERCATDTTQGSGIGIWGASDVTIDGNEIVAACISGMQEHITVAGTDRFEVKNNHVHGVAPGNIGKEGICLKDGSSNGSAHHNHVHDIRKVGIYVDAWDKHTHGIRVYANLVDHVEAMGISVASESGGLLEDVRVENNVLWANSLVGIWVSACCAEGAPHHPMKNIVVVNNSCVRNGADPWGGGIAVENTEIEGIVVRNNLLSDNLSFQLAADATMPPETLTVDHNLIDGFRGEEGEIRGTNPIEGDPMLRDAAGGDARIMTGSAAIDAGSSELAPSRDYEGTLRPLDGNGDGVAAVDVGAFESTDHCRHTRRPVRR